MWEILYGFHYVIIYGFNPDGADSAAKRLESCIAEIAAWMRTNKLMVNDGETEPVFIVRTHQHLPPEFTSLLVRVSRLVFTPAAMDLAVIFDSNMHMD